MPSSPAPYDVALQSLQRAYSELGLNLLEFDVQAIIRAHLGHGHIPVSQVEQEKAAPFVAAWSHALTRSAAMYRQTYDIGARARARPIAANETRPDMPTPQLRSLLDLMADEGHDVEGAIEELDELHDAVRVLASHLRAVKVQSESSAAAIGALQRRATDRQLTLRLPLGLAA